MNPVVTIAADGGYWLAGILTVIAAVVVTVVILVSSRSGDDH